MPPRLAELDGNDVKMLKYLQGDADMPLKKLAELCGISEATCSRRLSALKKEGVVKEQVAVLDAAKLGLNLVVHVLLALEKDADEEVNTLCGIFKKHPNVLHLSYISGEYDLMMRVIMRDMQEYQEFADTYFVKDKRVRRYQSLFEMKRVKNTTALPL